MAEDMTAFKQWVGIIRDIDTATSEMEKVELLESQMTLVYHLLLILLLI